MLKKQTLETKGLPLLCTGCEDAYTTVDIGLPTALPGPEELEGGGPAQPPLTQAEL